MIVFETRLMGDALECLLVLLYGIREHAVNN